MVMIIEINTAGANLIGTKNIVSAVNVVCQTPIGKSTNE